MVANIDRMAFVGEEPWHGEGTYLGDKEVTAAEAIAAAGLDWEVDVRPLYARRHGDNMLRREEGLPTIVEIPHRNAVIRRDTGAVFGIVSDRYEPVQNTRAFGFFDEVVGEGAAVYHTAGSLGAGEHVWILAKLPDSIKVGGKDLIENYLLLANGHDGNFAFRFFWTPIRVVCNNTLNFAIGDPRDPEAAGNKGYKLSHFRQINRRLNAGDAREAIGLAHDLLTSFGKEAAQLAETPTTKMEIEGLLQRLFPLPKTLLLAAPTGTLLLPEPKRADIAPEFNIVFKKRDIARELIHSGIGNKGETRWDVLNGIAEYTDYFQGQDRLRPQSLLFGTGQHMKQEAFDLLRKGIK